MKLTCSLFMSVLLLALGSSARANVTFDDLFHLSPAEAEKSLGSERVKTLQTAVEDYNAVLNFKRPDHLVTHTQVVEGRSMEVNKIRLASDGGTATYEGHGYHLTVVHCIYDLRGSSETGVRGYMYGPVLTFDDTDLGSLYQISSVSFYPADKLARLLKD